MPEFGLTYSHETSCLYAPIEFPKGWKMTASQQDIESWLWESANILRGPVDPANLRDFVFPLLFLKD